jgi:hypothetical protein
MLNSKKFALMKKKSLAVLAPFLKWALDWCKDDPHYPHFDCLLISKLPIALFNHKNAKMQLKILLWTRVFSKSIFFVCCSILKFIASLLKSQWFDIFKSTFMFHLILKYLKALYKIIEYSWSNFWDNCLSKILIQKTESSNTCLIFSS